MAVEPLDERRSSSSERPIVPPVPAEFSMQQPRVAVAALEDLLQGGDSPVEPGLEARAEVGADVEDHRVRPDRRRRLERVPAASVIDFS